MKLIRKLQTILILTVALVCLGIGCTDTQKFFAEGTTDSAQAGQVEVVKIDYDSLIITLNTNGNSVVSYSTNKTAWNVVEFFQGQNDGEICMDISWIAVGSQKTLYFKGDQNTKVIQVTLPKQTAIKAKFDKVDGILTLSNTGDATHFQWRKSTDYTWNTVSLNEKSQEYEQFIKNLEQFRVKGAKLLIRTAQIPGESEDNPGARPSKAVTVSITKRGNAPNVSVNIKTLKLNTTTKMEYSLDGIKWTDCEKTMTLESLLPKTLYKNGTSAKDTVLIRKAETANVPYSKTQTLTIPAQRAVPTTVSYYIQDSKYVFLQFSDASDTNMYEYVVVKPGKTFDPAKAAWKTVKKTSIKLSKSSAPDGSKIYYRLKGTKANTAKGIDLVLPSAYGELTVTFPAKPTGT